MPKFPPAKLTAAALVAAGYRHDPTPSPIKSHCTIGGYTKWVRRPDHGKRYQIVFDEHDLSEFHCEVPESNRFSSHVQFQDDNGNTFDVHFYINLDTTVQIVEEFYERVFTGMGCRDYD